MDILFDNEILSQWLMHYGSIVLFLLLLSGILILPVPEETLMVLSGVLMSKGHLNIVSTIIAAYAGSIAGITLSYVLGRTAGHYLITKYGSWLGLTDKHLDNVHRWFERFGKWTLMIGYFIPGVRHFTGFMSGMSEMNFKQFALYAYMGAIVWVSTFLSLGYFSGNFVFSLIKKLEINIDENAVIVIIFLIISYLLYLKFRKSSSKTNSD